MDLTIPIIGIVSILGYSFSKNGKNKREDVKERETVSKNENPNGENIYHSVDFIDQNNKITESSLNSIQEPIESSKRKPVGINLPDNENFIDTINQNNVYRSLEFKKTPEFSYLNPGSYLNQLKDNNSLSPQGFDISKFNGRPMFRGMAKTVGIDNERQLEMFTGVSPLFQEKQAVERVFEPKQTVFDKQKFAESEDIQLTGVNRGVLPFDQIYTKPLPSLSVRPDVKSIDQLKNYKVEPMKSQYNTPVSKQKLKPSLGEVVRTPTSDLVTSQPSVPSYHSRQPSTRTGLSVHDRNNVFTEAFDSTVIPVPNSKVTGIVKNTILSEDTRVHSNADIIEHISRFGNSASNRQVKPGSNVHVSMNERGQVEEEYHYNLKSKHKRPIQGDTYVPTTLKQGNIYQHIPNPNNSRKGNAIDPKIENFRVKDFIEVSNNTNIKGKQRFHNLDLSEVKYENENVGDIDNLDRLGQQVLGARQQARSNDTLIKKYV